MLWVLKRTVSLSTQNMFKLMGKEINVILGAQTILIWTNGTYHSMLFLDSLLSRCLPVLGVCTLISKTIVLYELRENNLKLTIVCGLTRVQTYISFVVIKKSDF